MSKSGVFDRAYPADLRDGAGIAFEKDGLKVRAALDYRGLLPFEGATTKGLVALQDPDTGELRNLSLDSLPVTTPADESVTNGKLAPSAPLTLKGNASTNSATPDDLPPSTVRAVLGAGAANGLATLGGDSAVPAGQLALERPSVTVLPTGALPGTEQPLADQLKVLPRHFGVVANAFVNADGTLRAGATDQTAGLNAYFAFCRDNRRVPEIENPINGAGYLVLGTLTVFGAGDYRGEFIFPNYVTENAPIVIEPDPADVILRTDGATAVTGWSGMRRGRDKIDGLGLTVDGVVNSLKGYFVTVDTADEVTFGRDVNGAGAPRKTDGGHGFYVNSTTGELTHPLYVDFRPQGAPTNSTFSVTTNVNSPRLMVWRRQHGVDNNATVVLTTTGTLPGGLTPATTLYVVNATLNAFQLATSASGTPLTGAALGSGTHTVIRTATPPNNFAATFALPSTVNATAHGTSNGQPVRLYSTGTLPTGLSAASTYYVVNATTDAFQLAATVGGAPVTFTSTGTGTITVIATVAPTNGFTATINAPTPVTAPAHGMKEGCPIRPKATHNLPNDTAVTASSTGDLPGGLSAGPTFYVVQSTLDNFQLSASLGGAPIPFTSAGTGTTTITTTGGSPRSVPVAVSGADGGPMRFAGTGTLPAGISDLSTYFAVHVSPNAFYMASGPFLPGIVMGDTGTFAGGAHVITASPEWAWPWTDRLTEVQAQRVQQPVRITGLRMTFYRPAASPGIVPGGRNKILQVHRANTTIDLTLARNLSGLPMAQGVLIEKTYLVTVNENFVAGLLDSGTNYSIHVGMSNDVVINASSGVDCRRSFDTHRGYGVTINGGVWSNGIGGHWGVNVRVNDALINNGPHSIHIAGRGLFVSNCHLVIKPDRTNPADVRASVWNAREDEFNMSGPVVFKNCLMEVYAAGVTSGVTVINLEGPAQGYDAYRPCEMPDTVSMDSSNLLKIWGNSGTYVTYCQYLRDFDATMAQPIINSHNHYISPVVVFDNDDTVYYDNATPPQIVPRCRYTYRNAVQLTGGDCKIKIENARDMAFTALPGGAFTAGRPPIYDQTTARCVVDIQSSGHVVTDFRGGAFKRGKIDAPSYREVNRRSTWLVGDERAFYVDAELGYDVKRTALFRNPASGATIAALYDKPQVFISGTGTLASLTLALPANAREDQRCRFISQIAVTAATFAGNGLTVVGAPTALTAGQAVEFQALNTGTEIVWQCLR